MAKRGSVRGDPELVELFADDPQALAVTDAIVATQRRRTSHRRRAVALLVAVVGTAAGVGVLAREDSQAGVVERALAALPADRVLHLVLVPDRPAAARVNLRTGAATAVRHTLDEWFDPRTGERRLRDRVGAISISDVRTRGSIEHPASFGFSEAALGAFPAIYRRALETATEDVVVKGILGGKPVYWLRFERSPLLAVAVRRDSYAVARIVFRDTQGGRAFRVARISSLSPAAPIPAVGTTPRRLAVAARSSQRLNLESTELSESIAATRLGLTLHRFTLRTVSQIRFENGDVAYELLYHRGASTRQLPDAFVRIQESRRAEGHFGWSPVFVAAAAEGHLIIDRVGRSLAGYLVTQGRYVRLTTTESRSELVAIARRLSAQV